MAWCMWRPIGKDAQKWKSLRASLIKLEKKSFFQDISCCSVSKEIFPSTFKPVKDELEEILENRVVDLPTPNMDNPYKKEKQLCVLCKHKIKLDYKNAKLLSQFVSPFTGLVYSKYITGLCEEQYKRVKDCILKSQNFGFMPYMYKNLKFLKDPKICNVGGFKKRYQ